MDLTIPEAIIDLVTTNAELLASVNISKNNIDSRIAEAVVLSENKAIEPLFGVVTNQLITQTLLINLITL